MTRRAVEIDGEVGDDRTLRLALPDDVAPSAAVRVIVLFDEPGDFSEADWSAALSRNSAFDFLNDRSEDLYSLADGQPFDG